MTLESPRGQLNELMLKLFDGDISILVSEHFGNLEYDLPGKDAAPRKRVNAFIELLEKQGGLEDLWGVLRSDKERFIDEIGQVEDAYASAPIEANSIRLQDAPDGHKADPALIRGPKRRGLGSLPALPASDPKFVPRKREAATVKLAFDGGDRWLALTGVPDTGKEALLTQLANELSADGRYQHGTIFIDVDDKQTDGELTEAIWRAFFEGEPDRDLEVELGSTHGLLYLANLSVAPNGIEGLKDALGNATVLFTYRAEPDGPEEAAVMEMVDSTVRIGGFTDEEDMISLFEARYKGSVPETSKPKVLELCRRLDGNPGLIVLLGKKAFADAPPIEPLDPHPLVDWVDPRAELSKEELLDRLHGRQKAG